MTSKEKLTIGLGIAVAVVVVAIVMLIVMNIVQRSTEKYFQSTTEAVERQLQKKVDAAQGAEALLTGTISPEQIEALIETGLADVTGETPAKVMRDGKNSRAWSIGSRARAAIMRKHQQEVSRMYQAEMETYRENLAEVRRQTPTPRPTPYVDADLAGRLLAEERKRDIPGALRGEMEYEKDPSRRTYSYKPGDRAGRSPTLVDLPDRNDIRVPYVPNLTTLLILDGSLDDEPGVTFVFGASNTQGFTFTTRHAEGDHEFVFTETANGQ